MTFPDPKNLSADQIAAFQPIIDSTWHIWKSLAWIDHAKRNSAISSVCYAALELRLGVEMLWWANLFLALGGTITSDKFKKLSATSTKLYTTIEKHAPDYRKLVAFTQILERLDSSQPRVSAWDLDGEMKRIHYTMAQYLHADRDSLATKGGDSWMVDAYNRIETSAQSIAKQMRQKDGTGVMRVDLMPPEVAYAWMAYKAGEIDAEAVQTRLRLAQPILRLRRMSE